ncbi:hypothetical protein ABH933_006516 [Nocardia sp. GP40]
MLVLGRRFSRGCQQRRRASRGLWHIAGYHLGMHTRIAGSVLVSGIGVSAVASLIALRSESDIRNKLLEADFQLTVKNAPDVLSIAGVA